MEQIRLHNNTIKWYDYGILIFMILWSGGGFTYGLFPTWMLYMLPIVFLINYKHGVKLSRNVIWLIVLIIAIHIGQMIKFGGTVTNFVRPICILITCALFACSIKDKFVKMYFDIIYNISWICLLLWVICLLPVGLSLLRSIAVQCPLLGWENFENNTNIVDTLYIFSIPRDYSGFMRNSGPFWEPGRFTIYITLALAINLFYYREKLSSKKSLVLLLTNITTFSTTGYVAMSILFVGYIFYSNIKTKYKILLSIILIITAYYVGQLDFMAEKINEQSSDDATWSRFGAIAYHWEQIIKSPLIGYGPLLSTAYRIELFSSPNGLTDLMRYYGIPLSIIMYCILYKCCKMFVRVNHYSASFFIFTTILILSFSQTITYSPFYLILYFLAFNNKYDK